MSQDLQAGAEDEQDYEAPEEGNLIYKLYSLHDVLLMVRSSVTLSHTRSVGSNENKVWSTPLLQNCADPAAKSLKFNPAFGRGKLVPVHVLPKLEYQLCYGVECLSSSESCQLWTETLLHSSTVSYTGKVMLFCRAPVLLLDWPFERRTSSC